MRASQGQRGSVLGEIINKKIILTGAAPSLDILLNDYLHLNPLFGQIDRVLLNAVQAVYCMGPYQALGTIKNATGELLKIRTIFPNGTQHLSLASSTPTIEAPPDTLYRAMSNEREAISLDYFQAILELFYKGAEGLRELRNALLAGPLTPTLARQSPELVTLLAEQGLSPEEQQAVVFLIQLLNLANARAISLEQFLDFSTPATLKKPLFSFSFDRARSLGASLFSVVVKELLPRGVTRLSYFELEALFQLLLAPSSAIELQGLISQIERAPMLSAINEKLPVLIAQSPTIQQLKLVEPALPFDIIASRLLAAYLLCLEGRARYPVLDRKIPAAVDLDYVFSELPNLGDVAQDASSIKNVFTIILEDTVASLNNKAWIKGLLKPVSAKNVIGTDEVLYNEASCSLKPLLDMAPAQIGQQLRVPQGSTYLRLLAACFERYYEGPNTPFLIAETFVKPLGIAALSQIKPNALYLYYLMSYYTVQCFVESSCGLVGSSEEIVGFNKDEEYVEMTIAAENKKTALELLLGMAIGTAGFGVGILALKIGRKRRRGSRK